MDSDQEERMEMVRDFVNEARELLDDAEPQIIEMEKTALGSGRVDEEILNAIFRLFHSLKGTASFLDFQAIIGVTHEAETLLDIFRKGKAEITPYHVDLLCRTTDFVRSILDVVEQRFSDDGFEEEAESLTNDLRQTIAAISGEDAFSGRDDGDNGNGKKETPDLQLMLAPDDNRAAPGDQFFPEEAPEDALAPGDVVGIQPVQEPTPWPTPEEMGLRITPEMIKSFTEEALELCEEVESALLALERMPDAESAGQAFRAFHSIKGNAGFFSYGDLERISHLAENVLDQVRNGETVGDPATMSVLLKVVDAIRSKLSDLSQGGAGEIADIDQLCDRLVHLAENQGSQPADLRSEKQAGASMGGRLTTPASECLLTPSISQYSPASSLVDEGDLRAVDQAPITDPDLANQVQLSLDEEILRLGLATQEEILPQSADPGSETREGGSEKKDLKAIIEGIQASRPASGFQYSALIKAGFEDLPSTQGSSTQVETPLTDLRNEKWEDIDDADTSRDLTMPASGRPLTHRTPQPSPSGTGLQNVRPAGPGGVGSGGPGTVIRVDIDKLDKMLDLVGELVIAESMVSNNQDLITLKNERFGKAVMQLDKISREIQEVAMSMRMIPLAGVFRKMMRLVRDLAQKANKQVELEIIGEETEVDKTIIEQISDPLVHLIRNAVDHGLETPAGRLAAGKPEMGRVTLEAKHSAGEVWITVEDDGKGLNRDKIFQKGVEKGLVKSEDREMKDEEIWRLIFEPGFSTAEQVSSISGRGVGMDVVKRNIERLRGKVDIRSRAGVGTMFAVRIPLTLAIIEGMVVRVGVHRYTIPISSIKESFRPGCEQITRTPDGLEIVRIRGELQPVLRLHELYRVDPRYDQLREGILIMVENGDNKCCLFVDELLGHQQIVIKGLPGYLNHVKGISGCAILGDGEISLILDIAGLISSVDEIML
jgi:two-component system chemotaxis sensor kinase CheA